MNKSLILIAVLLSGCGTHWTRPNTSEYQWSKDNFDCEQIGSQMAYNTYGPNGALLAGQEFQDRCLQSRGYRAVKK